MNNKKKKIINGEEWIIKNGKEYVKEYFYVINTHRQENVKKGCGQLEEIDKFENEDDAINFLEKKFNESRNRENSF